MCHAWKGEEARNSSFELVHGIASWVGIILSRPQGQRNRRRWWNKGGSVLQWPEESTSHLSSEVPRTVEGNLWKTQEAGWAGWTGSCPETFCSFKKMPWVNFDFNFRKRRDYGQGYLPMNNEIALPLPSGHSTLPSSLAEGNYTIGLSMSGRIPGILVDFSLLFFLLVLYFCLD